MILKVKYTEREREIYFMEKALFLKAAPVLLVLSVAELYFTFWYYHHAKDNGLPGREYHKQTKKPLVSGLFGVLGADLLAASVVFFVLWLLSK